MKRGISIVIVISLLVILSFSSFAYDGTERSGLDIFSGLSDLSNWLKHLIVPEPDYFHNRLEKLNEITRLKFAGVADIYLSLNQLFKIISSAPEATTLMIDIPPNRLYYGHSGFRADFLMSARPYLNFMRSFVTAAFCIWILFACYHKLRTFLTEQE